MGLACAACGPAVELELSTDQLGEPAAGRGIYSAVRPRAIYLNRSGGVFGPGPEDSAANTSSVLAFLGRGATLLPGYRPQVGEWSSVTACVREAFAPFAVSLVETDPAPAPHLEVVVTSTTAAAVGETPEVGGLAPRTSQPLSGIVFVFGKQYPFSGLQGQARSRRLCAVILHEAGHALGLPHALSCTSVLHPCLSGFCGGRPEYRDALLACGELAAGSYETVPRPCPDGASARNEHQRLLGAFGPGAGAGPSAPWSSPAPTCAGRCGSDAPVPNSTPRCYCDARCVQKQDCCADYGARCVLASMLRPPPQLIWRYSC